MTKPLLYISYGMAKSGSTLGYQLVRTVLEQAGIAQSYIELPEVIRDAGLNFVEVIRPRELTALRDYAEAAGGNDLQTTIDAWIADWIAKKEEEESA